MKKEDEAELMSEEEFAPIYHKRYVDFFNFIDNNNVKLKEKKDD